MTKKVKARYEWGRWIADCPDCPNSAEDVKPGDEFLCGTEFPHKHATLFQKIQVQHGKKLADRYAKVPDAIAREQAWARGIVLGRVYKVVFPRNKKDIERVLRMRPVKNQNWSPGETLADLQRENKEHGIPEHKR